MNVQFHTTINILLCLSSLFPLITKSSGKPKSKSMRFHEKHNSMRRTMTINISDSRGKRHNLPLVGVDNVDLHRIATCTKAPGRLVCKSGRYNYVINGNFEFPAETLEKFVSALYQKAKDKESNFAVSLVAPDKEAIPVPQCHPTLPSFRKGVTESADQLQPVTIECELTDAKTLKETNPDYQPKPNEKVFKCITKRLGMKKKRNPVHVLITQDQSVNIIGSSTMLSTDGTLKKESPDLRVQYSWKLYEPFWEKTEHILRARSLLFSDRKLGDFVRKAGIASIFHKNDIDDEGNEGEKDVAGYFHHEYPRPRVRDYNHTCGDNEPRGWCPPLRSTTCLAHHCTYTSTLHPTFYTENPDDEGPDEDRRLRKRLSYKFRNPLLEFILPYGLKGFARGEKHCTGCSCTDSSTEHECKEHADTEKDLLDSEKLLTERNEAASPPNEEDYYDSDDSKCKCCNHRKSSDKQHSEKGHEKEHKCGHKQGCGSLEDSDLESKAEIKELNKHEPMAGGGGCKCCKCDVICCCSCPPKPKRPKCTKPKPTRRKTPGTTRSTRCTVITQKICIGLRDASAPTSDVLHSVSQSEIQLERPVTLK